MIWEARILKLIQPQSARAGAPSTAQAAPGSVQALDTSRRQEKLKQRL